MSISGELEEAKAAGIHVVILGSVSRIINATEVRDLDFKILDGHEKSVDKIRAPKYYKRTPYDREYYLIINADIPDWPSDYAFIDTMGMHIRRRVVPDIDDAIQDALNAHVNLLWLPDSATSMDENGLHQISTNFTVQQHTMRNLSFDCDCGDIVFMSSNFMVLCPNEADSVQRLERKAAKNGVMFVMENGVLEYDNPHLLGNTAIIRENGSLEIIYRNAMYDYIRGQIAKYEIRIDILASRLPPPAAKNPCMDSSYSRAQSNALD